MGTPTVELPDEVLAALHCYFGDHMLVNVIGCISDPPRTAP